jgi:hypothetical protein
MGQHAILSPSGAEKWLHCTLSARLEDSIPDKGSDYAAEGTLAHAVAELKLRKAFLEPMGPKDFDKALNKLKKTKIYENGELRKSDDYWQEILDCTDVYLDYINKVAISYSSRPYVAAEQKLDISNYAAECFGTGDCIIIGGETLHIIDYKHGKGVVVDAEENPQMMLYALGAIERYSMFYSIKNVVMTIIQPRAQGDSIKEWSATRDKLLDWGVFTVRPKAQMAFNNEGDFCPGTWCKDHFCRARETCRARTGVNTALEDFKGVNAPSLKESGKAPMPPLLSDVEVGEVLKRAETLKAWVTDLENYALASILLGKEIPGWKAVEGVSRRRFDDVDSTFEVIKAAGYDEALLV